MMTNPTWLITAASTGFGKAIALEALSRGHHVLATTHNIEDLSDLQQAGASTYQLGVTSSLDELHDVVNGMHADTGKIDILVDAEGYLLDGAIEETS